MGGAMFRPRHQALSAGRATLTRSRILGAHLPIAALRGFSARPLEGSHRSNAMQQSQVSTVAIATKLALVLAVFLAGSKPGAAAPEVCVLAPRIDPAPATPPALPTALVPLSRPTLFIREPLAEIRLERGQTILWSSLAPVSGPLEGPLAWPLGPLAPHQLLLLRLRPLGAQPDQFATIHLRGAPPQRLAAGDAVLRSLLAGRPAAWRPAIEGLLTKGDRSLATALLFASQGPDEPELNALRRQAVQGSCR